MKTIKRKTLLIVAGVILGYVMTYGFFRHTHFYVHGTGSYRDGVRHRIGACRAAPVYSISASLLLYIHYPLKITEEIYWNRNRLGAYFRNGLK